ncbi:hypothetical protein FRC06_003654 [Ceratobasidium sp. 370]|nr:hypothetical protein FRC06_003654 [Ceratobasidium sp. 370]
MKLSSVLGVGALLGVPVFAEIQERQTNTDQTSKYLPSPGSAGFYAGNSSAAVTFDQHSIMLDGKRIMVFGGEFHPWRLPSIPLWRDILEKMKAGGFNAVSIYIHWGITEGKRGVLNFEGHRSITKFLDIAKDVGILVIVRPGPYINAETAGGGMPAWTTNMADRARSNGTDFTAAWTPYISQVSKYVSPYQYPAGPVILMQSENEFLSDGVEPEIPSTHGHTDYMRKIIETMRKNGVNKIPIYDYAAAISEDRTLTPKFSEIKLQGLFLHATPHYHLAGRISTGTSLSSSSQIFTTHLATTQGQNLYIVRQTTNNNTARVEFSLKVNTTAGEVTLPGLALNGRESKIIVSEYPFGKSQMKYSTAEVATWTTIDGEDHIVLYTSNQTTITALYANSKPTVSGSASLKATLANGTALISGPAPTSGLARVSVGKTSVWLADKSWLAPRIWQPRVSGTSGNGRYDLSPRTGSVLVFGPYLVRNATIKGSTLAIAGDLKSGTTTELEVLAPSTIKSVTWNGQVVQVSRTPTGTLKGSIGVENLTPKLPTLKALEWRCTDSLPEVAVGFDDSKWATATKNSTARPAEHQPYAGKVVLYADEYGYHGGFNFGYSAFLNGVFLGSGQGRPENDPSGGTELVNATYTFPAGVVGSKNVLTIVVDNMGIHEDWNGNDEYKSPRGVRGYELLGGGDFSSWKLTGNVDGEDIKDIIRGPLNQGGLYVERIGAIYPNYKFTSAWNSSKSDASCTPYAGISKAGIKAYKTKFSLNIDQSTDTTISFKFQNPPNSNYRARLYVNGWQFGHHVSNLGPQTVYPIPEGILNHRGENDILLALWSLDPFGAKVDDLELISATALSSSKEVVTGLAA